MTVVGGIDISARWLRRQNGRTSRAVTGPGWREALAMIEAETLVTPAYSYRTVPVREVRGEALDLGDFALRAHGLQAVSSKLTGVAAIACTLGPAPRGAGLLPLCCTQAFPGACPRRSGQYLASYTFRRVSLLLRAEARRQGCRRETH